MKKADRTELEELEKLYRFIPPKRLKKTLNFLMLNHVINAKEGELNSSTQAVAEDIDLLLRFIDRTKSCIKRKKAPH